MKKVLVLLALALLLMPSAGLSPVAAEGPQGNYYRVRTTTLEDGTVLAESLINGPPEPPPGFVRSTASLLAPSAAEGVNILSEVPAFNWSFGCSATSAAMIAGYYDRTGYANMYAGPTNGGLMPLDNSSWPDWYDGTAWRHQCPLSATHLGLDGRASEGHVDDYWVYYGHEGPDPLGDDGLEHTYGDCTGDYMKTNQSAYGNVDGGTTFWNYTSGSPLYCSAMPGHGIDNDGAYGLKEFYESRGYTVTDCYNQYIQGYNGNTTGFTWAQYKAEIDAGRPVMFHVVGHTMVGVGYDDASNLMYIHDTWDYNVHTMTWGDSYSGMQHYAVTIVQLEAIGTPPDAPSDLVATAAGSDQIDLTWTDNADDEAGFKIERSLDASAWALLDTVGANVTSYQDTGLQASTTYYYRVYAYNGAGNSAYSNQANATTSGDTTPPAPPAGLTATGRDGAVDLAWSPNGEPDLAGYTVYRSTSSGGPYAALTASLLSDPGYTDSSVTNGTTYYYVVTASDASDNESGYSNEAAATPQVQGTEDVASADYATTYGTVVGTYLATHTQDDSYQSLTEVHSGGKPILRHDRLE
ncbi:MAG: fibronectin type III domain-containing protein, partial [Anaerolineae bacterium]